MFLTPYDKNELKKNYKRTKLLKILEDFRDMDCDCVKVEGTKDCYKNVSSAMSSFRKAIIYFKMNGIRAMVSGGVLYLVKTEGEQ